MRRRACRATPDRIGDLITEDWVPSRLAGALLEAARKLSGVRRVEDVADALGRRGFGISRTDEFSGLTTTWVFASGSPLPTGTLWQTPNPDSSAPPIPFGATAVTKRGVADESGEPPLASDLQRAPSRSRAARVRGPAAALGLLRPDRGVQSTIASTSRMSSCGSASSTSSPKTAWW